MTQPTLHRGKLAKAPKVVGVRPLTREDMIALQSMMSKWQMMSPMTINMARALSDTTGAIIRNIK